jgi:hypothetical protein
VTRSQGTFVRSDVVLTREVENALLLLAPHAGGVVSLSGSGPEIWRLLRSPLSCEELVRRLADRFEVSPHDISEDVHRTLEALLEARVIRRGAA